MWTGKLAAMVFAAGFGTRMGALTAHRPKPLIPVAGRSLIDHALDHCTDAAPVVVNAHYHAEMMKAHLKDRPGVTVLVEAPAILDTGGGLKSALPALGNPSVTATLNADAIFSGPPVLAALAEGWREEMEGLLLLVPQARARGRKGSGDFGLRPDGRILRNRGGQVYTGVQLIRTGAVAEHPGEVFSLNAVWDGMIARGTLFGCEYRGDWADVGTPEGIGIAEAMLARANRDG